MLREEGDRIRVAQPSNQKNVRGTVTRPVAVFAALAGLAAILIVIGLSLWMRHDSGDKNATPPAVTDVAPSFDTVRVSRTGETVIAGRAQPRAEVQILNGGQEIGRVIADNRGEWVFVPDHPLPPGSAELSLKATNPDGTTGQTDSPVVIVVGKDAALAVKVKPDGTMDILQGAEPLAGSGDFTIAGIRYDSRDRLSVTGKAPPKTVIMVYVDEKLAAHTTSDKEGRWHVAPKLALHPGAHAIRADAVDAAGKVTARVEVNFTPSGELPSDGKITVEEGNSLWRIARRAYGSGFEYMAIYQANKEQIRDPNKIYPGQVIELPKQP